MMSTAVHSGDMICKAAEQKEVDILVVGRRGVGKFERMITGSTSQYVLEHAHCNVFVVKSEISAPELHSSKRDVLQLGKSPKKTKHILTFSV